MKKATTISACILMIFLIMSSCKRDFFNRPMQGALNEELLANEIGVNQLLTGAYSALAGQANYGLLWTSPSNWIYGSVAGGDAHKGSSLDDQGTILPIQGAYHTPTNDGFDEKWRSMYEGVSRTNIVLRTLKKATSISDDNKKNIEAQARLLRAYFYFELKKMFNKIPWIDENTEDPNQPNTEDIWPNIIEDLKFAYDNLPAIQQQKGRLNKWAAGAMLAKAYLFQHDYQNAKMVFDQVILQGETSRGVKYSLASQFEDNFLPKKEATNPEAVFQIEMAANVDGDSFWHANPGDLLNFPYNGPFTCCGFYQPTQDLVNHYRTNPVTGLPYVDDYNQYPVKSDMGILSDSPFTPDQGTLDPRLDWTVGRRGIPYLDWGNHPGRYWIVDQPSAGPYSSKKNVWWQVNDAEDHDPGGSGTGTAINLLVIRFADVLLMTAECEAQLDNLDKAEEYVNAVRARAANPEGWVYQYKNPDDPSNDFSNIPAANYLIKTYPTGTFTSKGKDFALKAIYYEKQIELAMEGHRFFDLVRWGIADEALNAYFTYESKITTDLNGANFTKGKNEYFPIPQIEIDLSVVDGKPVLQQNPGYK